MKDKHGRRRNGTRCLEWCDWLEFDPNLLHVVWQREVLLLLAL